MVLVNWRGCRSLVTLLIFMIIIPKSTSTLKTLNHFCSNSTTSRYGANSSYPSNLNTLLHSLSTNAATNPTGFYSTSAGSGTDNTVYGVFLCRGDQNRSECSECVAAAVRELPKTITCPRSKDGIIWYDECMVRYDSQQIAGISTTYGGFPLFNPTNISGDQQVFTDILGTTMKELAIQAANSPQQTGKKYANKMVDFNALQNLYTMVQCTPDLSATDCTRCLMTAIAQLEVMQGGRVVYPSCNVRYEIYPFLDTDFNSSAPPPSSSLASGKNKVPIRVIIAIVALLVAMVAIILILSSFHLKKKVKKYNGLTDETGRGPHSSVQGMDISDLQSLQYDITTIKFATNSFSNENKLGEGGFGVVYKGTLANGQQIAVKKLSRTSSQGTKEFKTEVLVVAKLQHRNLVRFLGYCLAGDEKLLIYEYVPNKSLNNFLFDPIKQGQLDWGKRYRIIEGIARGMLYLHQDSQLRIIHRDLKASNILLDENMDPKISDFGIARIFSVDQTQGNTSRVVGTYGYMAPEYAMHGQFSIKSDVYSFGVLVMEIISGKRSSSFYQPGNSKDLLSYGWKKWKDGMPLDIVDPTIRESCSPNEVMRCLHIGLSCLQESVDARPTMATVVLALDSHSVTLSVPEQPVFLNKTWTKSNGVDLDQLSIKPSSSLSLNDVSITELDPR